jgi:IMP cyclohydrolase
MNQRLLERWARENLFLLKNNFYPGRGILVGLNETGTEIFQVYWVMGRSESSRNRILVNDGSGQLRTDLADLGQRPKDTSLIIYCAMAEKAGIYVVSNGHQTKKVLEVMLNSNHYVAVLNWDYEPDVPNFTPRITATYHLPLSTLDISLLKKSPFNSACDRQIFSYRELFPGIGYCVTTYASDGNPLPSFSGEPYLLPLSGSEKEVAKVIWSCLNPENRVALAIKTIELKSGFSTIYIINQYGPGSVSV